MKLEDDLNAEETSSEDEDELPQEGRWLKDLWERDKRKESWDEDEDSNEDEHEQEGDTDDDDANDDEHELEGDDDDDDDDEDEDSNEDEHEQEGDGDDDDDEDENANRDEHDHEGDEDDHDDDNDEDENEDEHEHEGDDDQDEMKRLSALFLQGQKKWQLDKTYKIWSIVSEIHAQNTAVANHHHLLSAVATKTDGLKTIGFTIV